MKIALFITAVLVACGAVHAQPAASQVLQELARQLAESRANPTKSPTRCPGNVRALVGMPIGHVLIELGQPSHSSDRQGNTFTYEFGRPKPDTLGGGNLVLVIHYDGAGAIKSVECGRAQ